ncbi:guanine deaminase [Flavonifractor sp. An52]|uniref:amidohydrolase family protein n=1 Tax=Flavonifractor sp. An52 TaxID=1965642 RepID=UPI000B36B98A|nr:amidohydrolase family protein [Flavonifractor sp. An52]OUN80343.1 guanine deaminase [Flavonifractor sp. An52]
MILKGTFLHTPKLGTLEVRPEAYLISQGETIVGLYDTLPPEYAGQPVEDWGDALIIPAFTDLHIHAPQIINRGIGYDKELLPWLETYTFPAEARFADSAFADRAWKAFLNHLWAVGTLRFSAFATIHKDAAWRLMELSEASGLRGLIGKVNMDRNSPDNLREDTDASLADTEELICRSREALRRTGFILTPRFVPSTTARLMDGLGRLGEKYDLPIQSHLSENQSEVAWVAQLHPDIPTYTQVYEHFGLLRQDKTIMAHAIHLSDGEKALLREKGVMLAHCALSNTNLSSGIMPLRQDLEQGLRCCVASDVAGGHTANLSRSVTATVQASKLRWLNHPDQAPLSLTEAFYLATRGAGSFFGQVGAFLPGFAFDALVLRPSALDALVERTPFERLEQFLYDGDDRNIAARYCAGELIPQPFSQL